MNLVFWLLVVTALTIIWFTAAFLFMPIGKFFFRLWQDAVDEMNRVDEEKEK